MGEDLAVVEAPPGVEASSSSVGASPPGGARRGRFRRGEVSTGDARRPFGVEGLGLRV